ncbi:DUF1223 domain-containing protein [soil metagenome]
MRMILSMLLLAGTTAASAPPVPPANPVVVELFQSQGCSSCPPADGVLNELAGRNDVIALNFAVTYWDYLGWKDSFAQPAFTRRQWEYAKAGGRANVATPQMIISGRTPLLGSRRGEVDAEITRLRTAATGPALQIAGNVVTIPDRKASARATLWLVRYDPRAIVVPIRAGENGGRTIIHRNIVRELTSLGTWNGKASRYELPGPVAGFQSVLILQAGPGGPVMTARRL